MTPTLFNLLNGFVLALLFLALVKAFRRYERQILAAFLIIAALVYVFFGLHGGVGPSWVAVELAGVVIYGGMALRGIRGSPAWLAAGWALHPTWDLALHFFGPGRAFAPDSYTVACVSFDLLVSAWIAYTALRSRGSRSSQVHRGVGRI